MAKVEHVIADSAAFIKNAALKDIGDDIMTVREVVSEIRDKVTRQRLQVLPYELKFREPSTDSIRVVTEFSKKTGDYRALSAVDIRVMALTYQLEKEHCGTEHLKLQPDNNIEWQSSRRLTENPTEIAGFYLKSGKSSASQSRTTSVCESNSSDATTNDVASRVENITVSEEDENKDNNDTVAVTDTSASPDHVLESLLDNETKDNSDKSQANDTSKVKECCYVSSEKPMEAPCDSEQNSETTEEMSESRGMTGIMGDGDVLPASCLRDDVSDESEEEESDDEDDDEGWITPANINQMRERMGDRNTEQARVKVACLTTDFAMQNVLLQMGLHVISVEGMLIKKAKSYVLRCYACFKISTDTMRMFCGHCGNSTLQRVSMTTADDGSIQYFVSSRKPLSTKGKRFSLPAPRGGKYSNNPILVADQREAQQRGSKASRVKYNVMDADYVSHQSPFAPHDTHSRAAQLGFNRWGKRNGAGGGGGGGGKKQGGRRR